MKRQILRMLVAGWGWMGLGALAWGQVQLGAEILGAQDDLVGLNVVMPDAVTLAVGSPGTHAVTDGRGMVRVLAWSGSAWVQKGLPIEGEDAQEGSGNSIAMPDANTIAIGAEANSNALPYAGAVRIYDWDGNAWVKRGPTMYGFDLGVNFGHSLAMSDPNTVAIGSWSGNNPNNSYGFVEVRRWDGQAWVLKGMRMLGEHFDDYLGLDVELPDSNTLAMSALYGDGSVVNAGHVRIMRWDGNAWVPKGQTLAGPSAFSAFGNSMSMPDSNTIAVSAEVDPNFRGLVRVFAWDGIQWQQRGQDLMGLHNFDMLGRGLSMPDANTLAVGIDGDDSNGSEAGLARMFAYDGAQWVQVGSDIAGVADSNRCGNSLCMPDAHTVAVGAPHNDLGGNYAGQVRVFTGNFAVGTSYAAPDGWRLSPNPSRGRVRLEGPGEVVNVVVRNSIGQVVHQSGEELGSKILELRQPAGLYWAEVLVKDGSVVWLRMVVE